MDRAFVGAGKESSRARRTFLINAFFLSALALPATGFGQIVTPKTLPVLQDGQFDMYPSARAGMGGATIALDDSLSDPFVNPAKASRIGETRFFASPYVHSISGGRGGGRSIPVGFAAASGSWSATGLVTMQQLDRAGAAWNLSTAEQSAFNQYASGSIAKRLSGTTSVGLAATLASLDAIDGVDLLYAGSDRISQSGSLADVRLGITREMSNDRHFELMLLHARSDMKHDVHFTTWRWDQALKQTIMTERSEVNEDRTHIWGLHSEYSRPLGSEGWHVGWLGTANRLGHPKIPNYSIQNIPRDPGTTYGFNVGTGIGRTVRRTSFGADLIYEPMFSDTWADAARDTAIVGGGTIAAGGRTVENTFRFSNVKLRLGVGQDFTRRNKSATFGYQLGLGVHAINYKLEQTNNIQKSFRTQREDWMEWTPTFGLRLRSRDMDLLYNYSVTCGPGSCGGGLGGGGIIVNSPDLETATGGGIIAAPSGTLFMQSGSLQVHKLTVSLPIR